MTQIEVPDNVQEALAHLLEMQFNLGMYAARRAGQTTFECKPVADALVAVCDGIKAALKDERERCMGAMDSHGRYWVENRGRIIDAVAAAGYRIESNRDRCWLAPLGPNATGEPHAR